MSVLKLEKIEMDIHEDDISTKFSEIQEIDDFDIEDEKDLPNIRSRINTPSDEAAMASKAKRREKKMNKDFSSLLKGDPSVRKQVLAKIQEDNKIQSIQFANNEKYKEERRQQLIWQRAMYEASSTPNNCVSLPWQYFGRIHESLYQYSTLFLAPLLELRIPGLGLESLPDELGLHCASLKVLSVQNNELTTLPDSILKLTNLVELNLVKNKLVSLPDRIGLLCNLQRIELANNLIERLPITFGALNQVQSLTHSLLLLIPVLHAATTTDRSNQRGVQQVEGLTGESR